MSSVDDAVESPPEEGFRSGFVALYGRPNTGKSTIVKLLFRFYDATAGSILLDGQNIRSVTQDSLRQQIGIVPQDTVLFNDTIYHNIAYGRPDASPSEVEEVLMGSGKLASVAVIGLPDAAMGEKIHAVGVAADGEVLDVYSSGWEDHAAGVASSADTILPLRARTSWTLPRILS